MHIDEIRSLFSKAGIVVSEHGVSIIYLKSYGWVTQGINNPQLLAAIIKNSEAVVIENIQDVFIRISFITNRGTDINAIYPPVTKQLTQEEINAILEEVEKDSEWNLDWIIDGDTSEDGLINSMLALMEKRNEGYVVNLPKLYVLQELINIIAGVSYAINADYEIMEAAKDYDGDITMYPDDVFNKAVIFKGKLKKALQEAVLLCSCCGIECSIDDRVFGIQFFV